MTNYAPSAPLSVTVLSARAIDYQELLNKADSPDVCIAQCADSANDIDPQNVTILLADPGLAVQVIPECNKLVWCQSTWAGNAPLLKLAKQDYQLTGVKGVFGAQMREFVFAYMLHFSRNIDAFRAAQTHTQTDKWCSPDYSRLCGKTLGIMGAGSIAKALLPAAKIFNMNIIGLNNSGDPVEGFDGIFTAVDKKAFAGQCDYIVNLLPDTPATHNIIDSDFFNATKPHSVLINTGRGSAIDDDALLHALNNNQLQAAVLDVFSVEPLPDVHPFWAHPKVWVTQHSAAESFPEDIINIFLENAARFQNSEPLKYQFDFEKGY
ncbi:D-2-hydroxyacid dehydrogenase [Alteromonas pelagimontana]|uniref:D-2-hydroxyacid dehydrogenase n=1 Tax=Alteromonas pelagimontana TaxID=1858656 RepID=A0A6M4MBD7_9ALTE|nr:D-2-hydroxyacid dehydrogenase [Alteromonas pelagimontana]QJR80118.1 D-2-hydroxyacid dehydrogenase [Alteromonas pelagimontana]